MACPICHSPDGTAISEGIRAGAMVLIGVSTIVVGAIVSFGVRLWAAEGTAATAATEGTAPTAAAEGTEGTECREGTIRR